MNRLPRNTQIQAVAALTEGCSIRATERLTGAHRDTIMRLGVRVGEGCHRLHDAMMRDLQIGVLELDEQWAFIGCKQKRTLPNERERGDCYVFVALDATSKAVVSYTVGKRTWRKTNTFLADLRARIVNRPQITSDGFPAYPDAIDAAFGAEVDYATIEKEYATVAGNDAAHRYSPGSIRACEKTIIRGEPDPIHISTSYVERFNLSTRMGLRRFTRLTNAFSKTLANHHAAIGLQFAFYNFCRWHETLRCTPAMALGLTDHVWSVGELLDAALSTPSAPPLPSPERPRGMSAGRAKSTVGGSRHGLSVLKNKGNPGPRRFRVVKGGRG